MTPQDVITEARSILNDTDATSYRYTTSDLLAYFNNAIKTVASVRPNLFYHVGSYTCIADQCEQKLDTSDAVAFVEVLHRADGVSVRRTDLVTLEAFNPRWRTDIAAPAIHWMAMADDPLRFYIYPRSPVGQVLTIRYVHKPPVYGITDNVAIPDTIYPALVDYVVGMAESRDDAHVTSQRAAQFMSQFVTRLKTG